MTVQELIKHLSTLPYDLKVGRSGHFGEFHSMDKHDFYPSKIHTNDWGGEGKEGEIVLDVNPPDIGPEPD